MKSKFYVGTALTAIAMAAALASPGTSLAQEGASPGASLLAGKVVSMTGEALAGIPIKAHRDNSPITVAVYTDAKGEYSFPTWSDLTPGSYSVAVELPDFERTARPVAVAEGKTAKIDFTLKSKPLAYEDATASEIIAGLPGTDHQKVLFSQCSNCHTLQWALAVPRTKEDWVRVVKKMAGRAAEENLPGTYQFSQQQFIEPLAEYLTQIRGPGSSAKIPFKQRPRPTDAASTNLVVTEYALPRGGERELYMFRGDRRFVWPHDVIMNDKYAYYTDHFSYVLGRVDVKTGDAKEIPFQIPKNAGIYDTDTDSKGRTHLYIMRESKIGIFDPKTAKYEEYKTPTPMAGPRRGQIDGQNRLWAAEFFAGQLLMFDPDKKLLKEYPLINGAKPYTAPYGEPYSASADDKNQIVWTHDFSSGRLYRIDLNTGHSTDYLTPSDYEVRDLKVDTAAERPTVWVPAYRPPSKLVKFQVR